MKIKLYTEELIKSAHQLNLYKGKCSQLHGHTWKICVWVEGDQSQQDEVGILWDFGNLKKITNQMDHKFLNDVITVNPTAENICIYIYTRLKDQKKDLLYKVRVYESIIDTKSYSQVGDF